jgi:tRNA modification GTPase
VAAGARLATPGEFSKRAFLNGRLDLSQAEAVLDAIRAKSAASLSAAQRQLRGDLAREVDAARNALLRLLAELEAGIDFVGEDIEIVERRSCFTPSTAWRCSCDVCRRRPAKGGC